MLSTTQASKDGITQNNETQYGTLTTDNSRESRYFAKSVAVLEPEETNLSKTSQSSSNFRAGSLIQHSISPGRRGAVVVSANSGKTPELRKRPLNDSSDASSDPQEKEKIEPSTNTANSALIPVAEKLLLQHSQGHIELCYAAIKAIQGIIRGKDVNHANNFGYTPLMYACFENTGDFILELINAGAELNRQAIDGDTALLKACEYSNLESVKKLIEAKADLNIQDNDGHTPLMVAMSKARGLRHSSIDNKKRENPETAILIIKELLSAGASVNLINKDGDTVLHYAASNSQQKPSDSIAWDIARLFFQADANENVSNKKGKTALDIFNEYEKNPKRINQLCCIRIINA